jgi:hypothetical protein
VIDYHDAVRRNVSLLLSEGHVQARKYPLWQVAVEADIVRERLADIAARDTVLMHTAIAQVIGGGDTLNDTLERLRLNGE